MSLWAKGMSADQVASAIKNAVADATNSSTLAAHMAQCERDKAEMKAGLLKQDQERLSMHEENQTRFSGLQAQLDKIQHVVWMAAGAIALISFLFSNSGWAVLAHVLQHAP